MVPPILRYPQNFGSPSNLPTPHQAVINERSLTVEFKGFRDVKKVIESCDLAINLDKEWVLNINAAMPWFVITCILNMVTALWYVESMSYSVKLRSLLIVIFMWLINLITVSYQHTSTLFPKIKETKLYSSFNIWVSNTWCPWTEIQKRWLKTVQSWRLLFESPPFLCWASLMLNLVNGPLLQYTASVDLYCYA